MPHDLPQRRQAVTAAAGHQKWGHPSRDAIAKATRTRCPHFSPAGPARLGAGQEGATAARPGRFARPEAPRRRGRPDPAIRDLLRQQGCSNATRMRMFGLLDGAPAAAADAPPPHPSRMRVPGSVSRDVPLRKLITFYSGITSRADPGRRLAAALPVTRTGIDGPEVPARNSARDG